MLHLAGDHVTAPPLLRIGRRGSLVDERSLADGREWIAQFMGKGCKEFILAPISIAKRSLCALADGNLLPQQIFGQLALCDISGYVGCTNNCSALVPNGRDCQGHIDKGAILPFSHGLVVIDALAASELLKNDRFFFDVGRWDQ